MTDRYGVKYKYPKHSCLDCKKYKCFMGQENCSSDFGKYGCSMWVGK